MRRPGRERTLGALSGILIAMATPAVAHADQVLEGESLTVPAGQGGVVSDPAASGGQALELWSGTTATAQIDAAEPYGRIWLHARGDVCDGAGPNVRITVDGRSVHVGVWGRTGFRDFEGFLDIAPGPHTVQLAVDNYIRDAGMPPLTAPCDRSLYLDSPTLRTSPPLFASDSWRNRPLPDTEAIDSNSAGYVAELAREARTDGAWVNANSSATPIYVAPVQTPTRQVQVDNLVNP